MEGLAPRERRDRAPSGEGFKVETGASSPFDSDMGIWELEDVTLCWVAGGRGTQFVGGLGVATECDSESSDTVDAPVGRGETRLQAA